jgi:ATP-binding cassette subfamily B protein
MPGALAHIHVQAPIDHLIMTTTTLPSHLAHRLPLEPRLAASPRRFIWHVARGPFRGWLLAMILFEAVAATCGILLPFALSRIITRVSSAQGSREAVLIDLAWPLGLFATLCMGELVAGRIAGVMQWSMAPRQRQHVARSLFYYLHGHSHRFLTDGFAGSLAHRVAEVAQATNQVLFALINEFWPIAITLVIANGLLVAANPLLGSFTVLWSIAFVGMSLVCARTVQPLAHAASTARSQTAGQIVDAVSNHATVRLFAGLEHETARLDLRYVDELAVVLRANRAMERVRLFQFIAAAILKVGVLVLAVVLWSHGLIAVGQFVMAVSLALLIISEARNLSRRFLDVFEQTGNIGSGVKAILRPHELPDHADSHPLSVARGSISFTAVRFRYLDGAEVFRDLTVDIPPGQRVGLVGLSGSGKSTFVSLLLRLYEPQSGAISVDGQDLRRLTQDSLRSQIGMIPQDPTLFHRTLRENIRYGRPDATDYEVEEAARRAHADEFIAHIPGGYDALVGERGVKLSGGQRQRIAIARVILKDAPVLILDEATSSLDSLTELAIQETLDVAMAGKTVIVIAHRLSTINHLDRILVFREGGIVEDGSHAELLQRQGSYHALWNRQAGGLLPDGARPRPIGKQDP